MMYAAFSQIDWVHLFGYMFDQAPVTRDTNVVVLEQDYVNKFTAWINNLGPANKTRSVWARGGALGREEGQRAGHRTSPLSLSSSSPPSPPPPPSFTEVDHLWLTRR